MQADVLKVVQRVTQLEAQLARSTRRERKEKKKVQLFCLSNLKNMILSFGV
jgi:hypothetical protein